MKLGKMKILIQGNRVSCNSRRDDDKTPDNVVVRLPKDKFDEWLVETPDPHLAAVWVCENEREFILGLREIDIAKALLRDGFTPNQVFDRGLISVKIKLAQSPLAPTIIRNAFGLPGQVRVRLKRSSSLTSSVQNLEPLIAPVSSSVNQFIDYLAEKYREKVDANGTVIVLFSGGWDSRLELSLVKAVLPKGVRLVLGHIKTNQAELEVVHAIASEVGAELVVGDADKMLQYGLSWSGLMDTLHSESTWRPTVPVYGTFLAFLKKAYPDSCAFGFSPFPLKGRDYDHEIIESIPRTGRVRLIEPLDETLSFLKHDVEDQQHMIMQEVVWKSLKSGTEVWSKTQIHDWYNWNAYYGNGYAHRVRSLKVLDVDPIYAHSDVLSRFMGLDDSVKIGTNFIRYALNKLLPEIESVPVLASTGDFSRGTSDSGGSFKDSVPIGENSRNIFEYRSDGECSLYEKGVVEDPMLFRIKILSSLTLLDDPSCELVKNIFEAGESLGGYSALNAMQLARFVNSSCCNDD